jgi:hypothetical protein
MAEMGKVQLPRPTAPSDRTSVVALLMACGAAALKFTATARVALTKSSGAALLCG